MYRFCSLLFCCLIFFAGCRTEGLKETAPSTQKPTNTTAFSVEGRVSKGIVAKARVTLHPLVQGHLGLADAVGSTTTDAKGRFALNVENQYQGLPAVLRVTVDTGISMITCDLIGGCGDNVPFGQVFAAGESFTLFLAVPNLLPNQAYNVTLLSDLAYRLVAPDLAALPAEGNSVANIQAQYHIANTNSRIASRFGVIGDLAALDLVDITQAAEVETASSSSVAYAVLNGAILEATRKIHPGLSLAQLIDAFADQYVDTGLPGNSESSAVITYAQILDEAMATISLMQTRYALDLVNIISELSTARGLAISEEPDQFSQGIASETSGLTSVEKAKSFVKDIRQVANSIDLRKIVALSSLSEFVDGKAADALAQFGLQVDTAELLSGDQPDHIFLTLRKVATVVFDALLDYYGGNPVTTSGEGLVFTHSINNDTHQFNFQTTRDACVGEPVACPVAIDLVISLQILDFGGNVGSQLVSAAYLDFRLQGSVRDGDLTMQFPAGSRIEMDKPLFRLEEKTENDWAVSTYLVRGENIRADVPLVVRKDNATSLIFNGALAAAAKDLVMNFRAATLEMAEEGGAVTKLNENTLNIARLAELDLDLASSIRNNADETFLGAINLQQGLGQMPDLVTWKNSNVEHCASAAPSAVCEEVSSEALIDGETDEKFLMLNAAVGFKASLKGVATPVIIEMSGERDSPSTNTINSLKVTYPGHAVSLNGKFNNKGGITALDARNLDGMHLYLETVQGKRVGALETPTQEKVADVIDMGQWVKLNYADGYFESL